MGIIKSFKIKNFKGQQTIIKIKNLSKSFGKRRVLDSINFNIKMPLYDACNKYHQKVMELARVATNNTVTDELLNELEFNYLNMCKE